jgi:selenide,water dikinase
MGPVDLHEIIRHLDVPSPPEVLVGMKTSDDAGVYRIGPDLNLVLTADFILPTCDDPYLYGRIAAANSLSDVYAMGGTPKAALNLCCFPPRGLDKSVFIEILRGGLDAITESGAVLIGGHTVKDNELKYGLAVTGIVKDKDIKTNAGARAGDVLILTKPIGTGVVMSAQRSGLIGEHQAMPVLQRMAQLNKIAAALMNEFGAHAATDITGFGLAGHALEVAEASGAGLRFYSGRVPRWAVAEELVKGGVRTGVTLARGQALDERIVFDGSVAPEQRSLFFDPQTSGGLLIAITQDAGQHLLQRLSDAGINDAAICGEVFASERPVLEVQP